MADIHQRLLIIRKRTRTLVRREEHVADVRKAFSEVIDGHRGNCTALETREPDPGEDARDVLATIRLLVRKILTLEETKKSEVEIAKQAVERARASLHASIFSDQLDLFADQESAQAEEVESEAEQLSRCRVTDQGVLVVEAIQVAEPSPKAQATRVPHDPETGEVTA